LKIIEKKISQEGFILVQDKSLLVDRLDRLTDKKVICDKCFGQLRQKNGKYRITAQEIEAIKNYRSAVLEKHNEVHKQISKIRNGDPNLNSWRNLIELTSEEDKKKFDDSIRQAVFLQDELEKIQNEQKSVLHLPSPQLPCYGPYRIFF